MPEYSWFQRIIVGLVALIGISPVVYFVSVETGIAEGANSVMADTLSAESSYERYVENDAFGVGEKLEFDINYGFINAGTATMEVARLIEYESRPCYQIVTRARSNSFFSTFYPVDDRVESVMDALGMYSWRFEKSLREGSYRSDRMHMSDQRNHLVFYNKDTVAVQPFVQDALSVLYYVRTQPLTVGESFYVETFTDGKKYDVEVNVLKREKIEVDAGSFDCIVVEPLSKSVGVFKNEGRLTVWLTDDRLRMPVLMKSKIVVGSISAELTDFELGEAPEL